MRLGMIMRIGGASPRLDLDPVLEAERLGYYSAWAGEAYGTDVVSPVAWVLARTSRIKAGTGIMQMPARTPACAAMTAMTLQALSGNRFLCGVGPSGPQVVEGWHGVPYGKPLTRTREYIAIIRHILAREQPLSFEGEHYQIPYKGPGASGLGKPLKSIVHGNPDMQFYTASFTPAGLRMAGEVADGTLPIYMSPEHAHLITEPILEGMASAGKPRNLANFDVAPYVRVSMGNDVEGCRDAVRAELALYIGGMGARSKNFYNDYVRRLGYEAEATLPASLIDEICLIGPAERIRDRLEAWKQIGKDGSVGTLILAGASIDALRVVAEAVL